MSEPGMNLTPKQLTDLISAAVSAAVAEAKKPAPLTEREQADLQQAQDMRLQQRDLVLLEQSNKAMSKRTCSHMRRDNTCSGVFVENGNYIICQQCQGVIRPSVDVVPKDSTDIFDTHLFNRLFQLCHIDDVLA